LGFQYLKILELGHDKLFQSFEPNEGDDKDFLGKGKQVFLRSANQFSKNFLAGLK